MAPTRKPASLCVAAILPALLLAGTGCSVLISSLGVPSLPRIEDGADRQAVRRLLGSAVETRVQGDGRRVDTHRVRRQVESAWASSSGSSGYIGPGASTLVLLPILAGMEVYATGKALYDSDRQQYEIAAVYEPDDHLLYYYDVKASSVERFRSARGPLTRAQWRRLASGECAKWSACLIPYGDELRRRAAQIGHAPDSDDEEGFEHLAAIARDVDEGRLSAKDGLDALTTTHPWWRDIEVEPAR